MEGTSPLILPPELQIGIERANLARVRDHSSLCCRPLLNVNVQYSLSACYRGKALATKY
jgi:hypothetical protein